MKTFIFDLDGTLVHTKPEFRYILVGRVLNEFGKKPVNKYIDAFWFESKRDEIIKNNFGLDPALFWQSYRKLDTIELRRENTVLYDDIDFVKKLKSSRYKTGIVTGAPIHIANLEVEMIGMQYFDAVIVAQASNGITPKPHQHGLIECLSRINADSESAVYIGNADEDVLSAKNANIYDVMINRGEYDFSHVQASMNIKSLYELEALLE